MNRKITDWKKNITHISDKGLVSRQWKECLQNKNKKTNDTIKNGKRLQHFTKDVQMTNQFTQNSAQSLVIQFLKILV